MWSKTLSAVLLASQLTAGVFGSSAESNMRRYADALIEESIIERRQSTTNSNSNYTLWDTQTAAACATALTKLNGVASNAAGLAVCYNLPFLDNSTGVFQADLRLYMVAPATGAFVDIPAQNVQVSLTLSGATVQMVNQSDLARRDAGYGLTLLERATAPVLEQAYAFVGQVNKASIAAGMNESQIQALVLPTVYLSAVNANGTTVNATLKSDASFVTGIFATNATASSGNSTSLTPFPVATGQILVAAKGAVFFVPGTKILIFPTAAIVCGLWVVLLTSTIAYGTIGRINFRAQYRRRAAMQEKGGFARI